MKNILFVLSAITLLSSCSGQDSIIEDLQKEETIHVEFTVSSFDESDATRAHFANIDGSTYPVTWTVGESLNVFASETQSAMNGGNTVSVKSVGTGSSKNFAGISGDVTKSTIGYSLVSPSTLQTVYRSNKNIELNIPSVQNAQKGQVDPNALCLVGYTSDFVNANIKMFHATAYFHIEIANMKNIKEIEIRPLSETYSISGGILTTYAGSAVTTGNATTLSGANFVRLVNGGSALDEGEYLIAVRPGHYGPLTSSEVRGGGLKLTITLTDGTKKSTTTQALNDVYAGSYYKLITL